MGKNRKKSAKMSVVTKNCMLAFSGIVIISIVMIASLVMESQCNQTLKRIGIKEKELAKLEDECRRETARWESCKNTSKLERKLREMGMSMRPALPTQIVRIDSRGRVKPGQIAVAKLANRTRRDKTAEYKGYRGGR